MTTRAPAVLTIGRFASKINFAQQKHLIFADFGGHESDLPGGPGRQTVDTRSTSGMAENFGV